MKVITELMEAYSKYLGLPLLLVNSTGEIDYKVNTKDCLPSKNRSTSYLIELKNISPYLNNPTIMSVPDDYIASEVFYIITPNFKVIDDTNYFFAAGPFLYESMQSNTPSLEEQKLIRLNEEDIEDKTNKIRNLHQLIIAKSKFETKFSLPSKVMDLLQTLGDFGCDIPDYNEYICNLLDDLLSIEAFDFLGFAQKNEEDVFVIKHSCGDKVQHLKDKSFYIGEGLLGKAVILGENFYWNKNIDTKRTEFFNRYGIFPNHLFGYTIKQDGNVIGIIFGGSFQETAISDNLLNLMQCIVRFISQRKSFSAKLMDSYNIQTIFANWLDLMDVTRYVKDKKHVSYKILDFCQTLNNGKFSCFSSADGEFFFRGSIQNEIITIHHKAFANMYNQTSSDVWINHRCIHFYLDVNFERYGLFTVEFDEKTDIQQAAYILGTVYKLIKQYGEATSQNLAPQEETIFQLLQTSMQEMNNNQYQLSSFAQIIVKKLSKSFQIEEQKMLKLVNICKVFPYSFDYLEKHISSTEEWQLLLEMQTLLTTNERFEAYKIEIKILAYIYKKIFNPDKNEHFDFLSTELKDEFHRIYETAHKTIEHDEVEIDENHIEKLTDLKGVISTLNLTSREKEILCLILEGLTNPEVGQYLNISVHTVKNHVTNIFKKLNVSDRIQAMAKIYRIKYEDG